jgi:KDO2-lipid IV(A) lauroyltransferase
VFKYILYRIGQFIAVRTPLKIGYRIASFISDVRGFFAREDRREVKENLRIIFPEKTEKEIIDIQVRMFRNFAKYLVDFFRFDIIDREYIKNYIRIENIHYFDEAIKKGKGVIVLTAHLGNWELGGVVIGLLGYPFWAVALPHKDKRVDKFFNSKRENKGVRVIPLGKAVRACMNLLKENKMVALVGDRDFTERGIVLDFFGKRTFFPEGAAAFALQTGAIIVPGFMLRNKDDSFILKIERPLEFSPSGDKKKDLQDLICSYKAIFEDYIRKYPDQWYQFRRFWIQ